MARNLKSGILITGDASGAVKATKLTRTELEKLNKTTANANKRAKQYNQQIQSFGQSAKLAAKAFAGLSAATVTASAAIFNSTRQSIDQMGKLAARLQVTTKELTGLQLAAELNGESTDKLNSALSRMQKRIGEAAKGTGAAKKALDELGISANNLARLNAADQFKILADAISDVDNNANRAAITAAIFSNQGLGLVNTLMQGSEGLNAIAVEAQRYGLALSEIDVRKVEDANDAFTRLDKVLEGSRNRLTVALSGPVEEATKAITESILDITDAVASGQFTAKAQAFADLWSNAAQQTVASFDLTGNSAETVLNGISAALDETVDFLVDAFNYFPTNIKTFVEIATIELLGFIDKIKVYADVIAERLKPSNWLDDGDLAAELASINKQITEAQQTAERARTHSAKRYHKKEVEELRAERDEIQARIDAGESNRFDVSKQIAEIEERVLDLTSERLKENEQIKKQHKIQIKNADELLETYKQQLLVLQNQKSELADAAGLSDHLIDSINDDLDKAFSKMPELFGGGGENKKSELAENLERDFSNVWVSFVRDGKDAAGQIAAIFENRMLNSLQNEVFSPLIESVGGGKGLAGLKGGLSNIAGNEQAMGALGQFAGTQLGGGGQSSQIGSGVGSLIGAMAIGGPIGLAIGGILGGIGGGLFDRDPLESKIQLQSSTRPTRASEGGKPIGVLIGSGPTAYRQFENQVSGESVFGTVGFTDKSRGIDSELERLTDAFVTFDSAIANLFTADEVAAAKESLKNFRSTRLEFTESNFFKLLADRVTVISDSLNTEMSEAVEIIAQASDGFESFTETLQDFAELTPQLTVLFGATADEAAKLVTGAGADLQRQFIDALVGRNGNRNQFMLDVAQTQLAQIVARTGVTFAESIDFVDRWQAGLIDVNAVGVDAIRTYQQVFIAGQEAENAQKALAEATKDTTQQTLDQVKAQQKLANETTFANLKNATDIAFDALVESIDAERDRLRDALTIQLDGITESFEKQRDQVRQLADRDIANFNTALDITRTRLNSVTSLFRQLDSTLQSITPNNLARRQRAQAALQRAIATGQAGGSLAGLDIDTAALSGDSEQFFSSSVDFQRDQAKTRIALRQLAGLAQGQMSADEMSVQLLQQSITDRRNQAQSLIDTLKRQEKEQRDAAQAQFDDMMRRGDDIVRMAQEQIDELRGIRSGVMSIGDAINSLVGALAVEDFMTNVGPAIGQAFATPSQPQIGYGQSGGYIMTPLGPVPAFADGGSHAGGFRVVGERGPELEFTGPSRIMSNKKLMDFDKLIDEVKALRRENAQNVLAAKQTAKILKKFDFDGLPAERTTS